jgi:hypothetical protein
VVRAPTFARAALLTNARLYLDCEKKIPKVRKGQISKLERREEDLPGKFAKYNVHYFLGRRKYISKSVVEQRKAII